MLRVAATALKNQNPNIKVIGAGGVSTASIITNINAQLGADASKVDIWSVHYYPPNEVDAPALNRDVITALGKPAWNTESGAADGKSGPTGPGMAFLEAGSYAVPWKGGQTMYGSLFEDCMLESVNVLTCVGNGMSQHFYYDGGKRVVGVDDVVNEWTWMHYDDSLRPKAAAVAGIWSLLDKSTGKGALTVSGSTCYGHLRGTTPLVSLWAGTNKTITLAGSVSTVDIKVYDIMGNGSTPGSLAVSFGRMPIIIEGQGSLSYSNLAYSVTNGTVANRADLSAPQLAITAMPKISDSELTTHFRWLAIDDCSTPDRSLQDGIKYRYSLDGAAYSSWDSSTWVNYDGISGPHALVVQAMDLAGNVSTASSTNTTSQTINVNRAFIGRIIKSQ